MNERAFAFYIGGINPANIDEASGVIRDVRIITEGSALGHDVDIDSTTINQILAGCQQYQNGVKVKMDHDGGAGDIPGYVTNFRKVNDSTGEYLLGDLHLFATHPQRGYILELARKIPDTFGLSCFFTGKPEVVEGRTKARCNRVFSCDIVTEPAANPSLFSVGPVVRSVETTKVDNSQKSMTPEEFAANFKTCMAAYDSEKEAKGKGTAVVPTKETHQVNPDGSEKHVIVKGATTPQEDQEKEEQMSARIAGNIMAKLAASGVKLPVSVSGDEATKLAAKVASSAAVVDDEPKTFERMVDHLIVKGDRYGKKFSRFEAIKFVTQNHPEMHEDYLTRSALDYPLQLKQQQMSRKEKAFLFKYNAEHWLVQGTPKPKEA